MDAHVGTAVDDLEAPETLAIHEDEHVAGTFADRLDEPRASPAQQAPVPREDALDVDTLQGISTVTNGRFFLALDRAELEGVYDELDRIEPELVETLSYRPKRSLFHVPLGGAAMLMVLFAILMLGPVPRRVSNA